MSRALFAGALIALAAHAAEPRAAEVASLVHDGWRLRVWSLYPVEKLKADDVLPAQPKAETIRITAAQGESERFVIALNAGVPLREVTVHAAAGEGIELSARRVGYIYVDEPSGTRIKDAMPYEVGTGQFPDPLLSDAGAARPGRNLQFLLTARVPRDAKPGEHVGTVTVKFRREAWMPPQALSELKFPLVVQVRGFALPERSSLLNTSYFDARSLRAEQRTPAWLDTLAADFLAHRQTPEPLLPSPKITSAKDGAITVDSAEWEAAVARMFDERGAAHALLPVWSHYPDPTMQGLYFLHHFPAVKGQRWFGALIVGEDRELTPEFRRAFGAYLRHMHGVLTRRGWLDRFFITTMDEPYTYHTPDRALDVPENNYAVIRSFVKFVRETAPGLRTFCTADPVEGLNGFIDHWCLRQLGHAAAARERAEQHGEIVTFCDNYRTFLDYPAMSARSFGWLAWKLGARGWLTYETLGGLRTAWEAPVLTYPQFSGATVWGMGQMFYPDPVSPALVPSLRWELMAEGCDDYEYLALLRTRVSAHPQHPAAAEARALLAEAETIVGGTGDAESSVQPRQPNEQSVRKAHQLRERIAEAVERLGSGG